MELRYVYRKIEDAIGDKILSPGSPHSVITQKLRFSYRESRDIAHNNETQALCLASISGNSRIDVQSLSTTVSELLDGASEQIFPYLNHSKKVDKDKVDAGKYDEYFRILKEMDEAKAKAKDKATEVK